MLGLIAGLFRGGKGASGLASIAATIGGNKAERYQMAEELAKSRIINVLTLLVGLAWLLPTINNATLQIYPVGMNPDILIATMEDLKMILIMLVTGKVGVKGWTAKQKAQLTKDIMEKQERDQKAENQKEAIIQAEEKKAELNRVASGVRASLLRDKKMKMPRARYNNRVIQLRRDYRKNATIGRFMLPKGNGLGWRNVGYSYELPWINNKQGISCIPEGMYEMEWAEESASGKLKNILVLLDVVDRSGILIHAAGNKKPLKDYIQGCIIPLTHRPKENQRGEYWADPGETTAMLGLLVGEFTEHGRKYLHIRR